MNTSKLKKTNGRKITMKYALFFSQKVIARIYPALCTVITQHSDHRVSLCTVDTKDACLCLA